MKRSHLIWLALFGALLVAAAWLMDLESMPRAQRPDRLDFPRNMRTEEQQRMVRRQTLPERPAPEPTDAKQPALPPRPRDPLLAAFPGGEGEIAMVGELNSLRHSPVGEMLLSCLGESAWREIEKFQNEIGVDPLEDLDRFGVSGDAAFLTGDFESVDWETLLKGGASTPWGDQGEIFEKGSESIGVWDDQMVIFGKSRGDVEDAIDRLEGRLEAGPATIGEQQTYGDIYGVVGAEALVRLLKNDQHELAEKIREVAKQVTLHVDASSDVAMVLDLQGQDADSTEDLARSLAGALSAARLAASEQGEEALADLLDYARVIPSGNAFTLELALPESFLAEHLGSCKWMRPREPETTVEVEPTD